MTTKAIEKTLKLLTREVANLRSMLISVVSNKDDEGEYKSSFVKEILESSKESPKYEFSGKGSLLKQLRKA